MASNFAKVVAHHDKFVMRPGNSILGKGVGLGIGLGLSLGFGLGLVLIFGLMFGVAYQSVV